MEKTKLDVVALLVCLTGSDHSNRVFHHLGNSDHVGTEHSSPSSSVLKQILEENT